ncbi:MAG: ATP-binding protein [Prevotella sp.]|jgi:predicted ATPase|nr:ATP-binding protein [Prevotella sp.]
MKRKRKNIPCKGNSKKNIMKLISFEAVDIFDYLNITMKFNKDLSIVTGGNGTGKTTAIRLMQAILTPNIPELVYIPFSRVSITFSWKNKITTITVVKDKFLEISGNNFKPFKIEEKILKEFEYMSHNSDRFNYNEHIYRFGVESEIIRFIIELPTPIFIGLDRRNEDPYFKDINNNIRRKAILNERYKEPLEREIYRGTLGISLIETEILIQDLYKRLRAVEDSLSSRLQKELIKNSFDFKDVNIDEITTFNYEESRKILDRKKEIREVLSKITGDDREINSKLDRLFQKLEEHLKSNKNDGHINLELLINLSQINSLTNVVNVIDDHNSKITASFKPINKYLNIVNSFFIDSSKSVLVDEVGHLNVKKANSKLTSIEALSSGERHIVVIFANAMFNKMRKTSNNILIIDEPELSLHIRWQEKFIDQLLNATEAKSQLILATHSPDIVGDYKNDCISVK